MEWLDTTYLKEILHYISQGLLVPVIVGLIAFICYGLFSIGSIIAEVFTERRNFVVRMPQFLADISTAKEGSIPQVVIDSGLLNRQKEALLTLWDYRVLPADAYTALAKRLLSNEDLRYQSIAGRTDAAAKLAPMLGLMGTLIPLGPGIAAMGQKQMDVLSSSLNVAFDTTVAGLIVAVVCFVISRIRKNWYENYMVALESSMTTILEKVDDMRQEGKLTVKAPTDTASSFLAALKGKALTKDVNSSRPIAEAVYDHSSDGSKAGE